MKNTRKGFTLVELVIVIAVIAILAGVLIGTFASVLKKAKDSADVQNIKNAEIAQKADDIIKKIEDSNWFGWEDFENSLAEKLEKVYKDNLPNNASTEDIKKVIEDSLTTYFANNKVENTSLTEEQVKAVIENALLKATLGGVTEAQVKAIVTAATSTLSGTQLTATQVKSIVNAAVGNGLTANDVAQIIASANLSTSEGVENAVTALQTATSNAVDELKDYIDGLKVEMVQIQQSSANAINAKAFNIVLSTSTKEMNSILDVYDLFQNSQYDIQHYSSSEEGYTMYYDKQLGKVICVYDETDKVVSPAEYEGQEIGDHDWFSLNMEIPKVAPALNNASSPTPLGNITSRYVNNGTGTTFNNSTTVTVKEMTATVTTGQEYAWIVEQYNNYLYTPTTENIDLVITLGADIDLRGAAAVIEQTKGNITIQSEAGHKYTIKNITNNKSAVDSNSNSTHEFSKYAAGAIISNGGDFHESDATAGKITIKDVIFENLNVKAVDVGNVGILIGYSSTCEVELNNVTITNSSVIGQRCVGALIGTKDGGNTCKLVGDIKLINSKIQYIGGRSALLGCFVGGLNCTNMTSIETTGSTLSLYVNEKSYQAISFDKEVYPNAPVGAPNPPSIPTVPGNDTLQNGYKSIFRSGKSSYVFSVKTFNDDGSVKEYSIYIQLGDDILVTKKQSNYEGDPAYYTEIVPGQNY